MYSDFKLKLSTNKNYWKCDKFEEIENTAVLYAISSRIMFSWYKITKIDQSFITETAKVLSTEYLLSCYVLIIQSWKIGQKF